jgi:hypothetical protein
VSWTTISVRREVRERIEAFMREKGFVSPSDTIAFLFEHYDSRTRLEEKVRELEDRLSFVEKHMEDLLFTKAPTSTPQAQAPQAPQQPQPSESPTPQAQPQQPPEPKLIPASELPEAKKALEEAKPEKGGEEAKPKRAREGVFKELSVKWIQEKAGKAPEEFMEEWARRGYNTNKVGDKVIIASDDVVESVLNELNARNVQGPGALQNIEDKELRRRAVDISAAGFIYFDATTKRWKRA